MKFAQLIAVASAVRLTQRPEGGDQERREPTPSDVIDHCDTDENRMLNRREVVACINEHVPEDEQDATRAMVDEMWPSLDTDNSGEVDEHELSQAMRAHEEERPQRGQRQQQDAPQELAKLMRRPRQ